MLRENKQVIHKGKIEGASEPGCCAVRLCDMKLKQPLLGTSGGPNDDIAADFAGSHSKNCALVR